MTNQITVVYICQDGGVFIEMSTGKYSEAAGDFISHCHYRLLEYFDYFYVFLIAQHDKCL
jgi:hypothetical protein